MKKYKKSLISEDFLCVPILLKMIVENEGYNIELKSIANYLGINLPNDYVLKDKSITNISYKNDSKSYGVVLQNDSINNCFNYLQLPFTETYYKINSFDYFDFENTLLQYNNIEDHLIFGLDYGILIKDKSKINYGHVCLFISIQDAICQLYNPGPHNPGIISVNTEDLYLSIKAKNDGIWVIHKKNRHITHISPPRVNNKVVSGQGKRI